MRTTEHRPDDGLQVLTVAGEIDLARSPELRATLRAYLKAKCPRLLLDFKGVDYVDSSGMATLIEYVREAQGFGGRIAIAELNGRVRTIFDLVRLGEFIPIHSTIAEARAALLAPASA